MRRLCVYRPSEKAEKYPSSNFFFLCPLLVQLRIAGFHAGVIKGRTQPMGL